MANRGPMQNPLSARSQERGVTDLALVPKRKPKPGTWLSKAARLEWHRAARMFEELGTLSAADASLLERGQGSPETAEIFRPASSTVPPRPRARAADLFSFPAQMNEEQDLRWP